MSGSPPAAGPGLSGAAGTTRDGRPGSRSVRSLLVAPAASAAGSAAAVAVVAAVDPHTPGRYGICPLLATTGLYCPFCGGLRAVHDLAHGAVGAACGSNVLVVLALPVVVALWLAWTVRRSRGDDAPFAPLPLRVWLVLLAGCGMFAVVRNLPVGAALAP